MILFVVFYTSLFLVIVFLTLKYLELRYERKPIMTKVICMGDEHCHKAVKKTKSIVLKIKFKNFQKLVLIIATWTRKEIIYLKRRFDSKQPKFFLKPVSSPADNTKKGSVSFFLRNVSEYKTTTKKKSL